MPQRSHSIWDALFGRTPVAWLPSWCLAPARFVYLTATEFNRNRCLEKASALGFQTVFSLIPALVLALFLVRSLGGLGSLSQDVTRFLFHQFNLDEIELRLDAPRPGEPSTEPLRPPATVPEDVSGDASKSQTITAPARAEESAAAATTAQKTPDLAISSDVRVGEPATTATGTRATQTRNPAGGHTAEHASEPPKSEPARKPRTERLSDRIQRLVDNIDQTLRSRPVNIVSLFWFIVAAMSLALTLEHSLNEIWGSAGRRGLIGRVALYWSILTLGPLLVVLSMTAARSLNASSATHDVIVSTLGPLVAFFLIYQLMPAAPVRTSAALLGAFFAAVSWLIALHGFRRYVDYAVSYGELYGSLGLLPLFLVWVWIAWLIVLGGGVATYTLQNRQRLQAAERRRRTQPFVEPGYVAVGIVLRASRAFRAGVGPVSAEELADATGLPDEMWVPLAAALQDRGLLCEVGTDAERFILARPPDLLTVNEVLSAVVDPLVARLDDHWEAERPQLQWLTDKLAGARRRELGELTISQLLDNGAPHRPHPDNPPNPAPTAPDGTARIDGPVNEVAPVVPHAASSGAQ